MDVTVLTYMTYLTVSIALTVWVARTLSAHGQVFLVDVFAGDAGMAASVNKLLVVGFYLLNLGYVSLALTLDEPVSTGRGAIEALSGRVGGVLLVLGVVHCANLFVLSRMRRRSRLDTAPVPPVGPNYWVGPQPPAATGSAYPYAPAPQ